jgi:HEAT repeat protein
MGELLVHEVPSVRMEALRYLEHLQASSELPRIRRCLDDPYIPMRIRAAEVLLCLDDKDSLKQIYKLLELKEAKIKVAGLLAQFGIRGAVSRITPMLKDQDQGARNSAIYALAELGAIEFNQEIRGLLEEEGSRIPAIWALAQLGDKESAPKIRRYLKDKDPKVRRITAQALVMLDDTDAIKDLQAQLSGEKDELARIEYIVALGRLGAPVPTSDLIKLLDHKMPHIQVAAANALASLNVKDGVEKIRGLLRKLPLYRLVLLKALGLLQDREVLQDLTELMQDRQAGIVLFYFNLFSSYELYRRISQLKPPKRVWCGGFKDIMNTLGAILRAKGITFKLDQGLSEALGNKYVRIYLPSQGTLEYLLEYIIRNFEGVTFMMDQGRIRLTSLGEARRLFKGYLQGVKDKR